MVKLNHTTDGGNHSVDFKDLHVLLIKNGEGWFARSLEIDYFSFGKTLESAKKNFVNGLAATVATQFAMTGSLDKLEVEAPKKVWDQYKKTAEQAKSTLDLKVNFEFVLVNEVIPEESKFPHDRIVFVPEDLNTSREVALV